MVVPTPLPPRPLPFFAIGTWHLFTICFRIEATSRSPITIPPLVTVSSFSAAHWLVAAHRNWFVSVDLWGGGCVQIVIASHQKKKKQQFDKNKRENFPVMQTRKESSTSGVDPSKFFLPTPGQTIRQNPSTKGWDQSLFLLRRIVWPAYRRESRWPCRLYIYMGEINKDDVVSLSLSLGPGGHCWLFQDDC